MSIFTCVARQSPSYHVSADDEKHILFGSIYDRIGPMHIAVRFHHSALLSIFLSSLPHAFVNFLPCLPTRSSSLQSATAETEPEARTHTPPMSLWLVKLTFDLLTQKQRGFQDSSCTIFVSSLVILAASIFTAQRYASAVYAVIVCLSVSPFVCHTPVL